MTFSCIYNAGRVAEWFKAPVLKTGGGFTPPREFESHPFRHRPPRPSARCDVGCRRGGIHPDDGFDKIASIERNSAVTTR